MEKPEIFSSERSERFCYSHYKRIKYAKSLSSLNNETYWLAEPIIYQVIAAFFTK